MSETQAPVSPVRRTLRGLLGALFITAGWRHMTDPGLFLPIVPPQLPEPLGLVYVSGVAEILGGVALFFQPLRRAAGWGLLALLVAVFPANIYAAEAGVNLRGMDAPDWMLWARLPLQGVLAWWVWWVMHDPLEAQSSS